MMSALYALGGLVALLAIAGVVFTLLGKRLPDTPSARVSVDLARPREEVWRLIDDVRAFPEWLAGINGVETLPDRDGRRAFRQRQGRNSFVLEETLREPPSRVVRTITDDSAFFSGSWDHVLEDLGGGRTRLTVTENGSVKHAIPRAVMHYVFGEDYYLKRFAKAMREKCGAANP